MVAGADEIPAQGLAAQPGVGEDAVSLPRVQEARKPARAREPEFVTIPRLAAYYTAGPMMGWGEDVPAAFRALEQP